MVLGPARSASLPVTDVAVAWGPELLAGDTTDMGDRGERPAVAVDGCQA